MTRTVDKNERIALEIKYRRTVSVLAWAACVFVGGFVWLCFAVTREYKILFDVVLCVWLAAGGCAGIYAYTAVLLPVKYRRALIKEIFATPTTVTTAVVKRVGGPITVKYDVKVAEVTLDDGAEHRRYWLLACGDCPFEAGKAYSLAVSDNYITAYGDAQ